MMDLIVAWICSAIAEAFEEFVNLITGLFDYDITQFNNTFPFAAIAYDVIVDVALAIALILAAWQVIAFFFQGADKAPATPIRAALNTVLAIGFIYYGNYFLELILQFCQYPYDSLAEIDAVEWGYPIGSWGEAATQVISDIFAQTSMLLYAIMLILYCFSFVKLLLEIVERYCITFILLYLSPLAASTLASSTTSGIYKKFITMFISQCLLLFLNVWCLKIACSGLSLSGNGSTTNIVSLLLCYAFLRLSSQMDTYINQLGLTSAITGVGLGAEMLATGSTIVKSMTRNGSGGGSVSGAGGGNTTLGAVKTGAQYMRRYNPATSLGQLSKDTVVEAAKSGSEAYRTGGKFWESVKSGAAKGAKHSDNLYTNAVTKTTPEQKKSFVAAAHSIQQYFHGTPLEPIEPSLENMKFTTGYRNTLNQELVDMKDGDAHYQQNIDAWSNNEHLARGGFTYVRESGQTVTGDDQKVAAIAKGLGIDKHSKEAAEFVKVGFGQADGVPTHKFTLDKTGMHGEYSSQDGYRYKMNVYDQTQYDNLTTQQRQGLERHTTSDGHRYYIGTTKTKLEPVPKEKKNTKTETPTPEQKPPEDNTPSDKPAPDGPEKTDA